MDLQSHIAIVREMTNMLHFQARVLEIEKQVRSKNCLHKRGARHSPDFVIT